MKPELTTLGTASRNDTPGARSQTGAADDPRGSAHARLAGAAGTRGVFSIGISVGVVFATLLTSGLLLNNKESAALTQAAASARSQAPIVNVVTVHRSTRGEELTLPGFALPFYSAKIYARATGYVGDLRVDIGDFRKTGELLARIDAPDLDQQVRQAEADVLQATASLAQARANVTQGEADLELAKTGVPLAVANHQFQVTELARINYLAKSENAADVEINQTRRDFDVTHAQVDQARATVADKEAQLAVYRAMVRTSEANLSAEQADLGRLRELQGFERVTAPYDGVVTHRDIDLGTLVTAGNTSPGTLMFTFDMVSVLKVQLDIPQAFAPSIADGMEAAIRVREFPDRVFPGKVSRTASSLDPATRTLRTQIDIPNTEHTLLPGTYLSITMHLFRNQPAINVPAGALITRAEGTRVCVVAPDGRLSYRTVVIARDLGDRLAVTAGVEDGDQVAVNLATDYPDGTIVSPRENKTP